ncbi:phosphatidylglycerophosphatase A [Komagataeibacter sp. AV436]|uniref:Phosphatidylglycerophosphatase A n=1 Tax=Komagataeibacter melomenusus TaxID=2766578 RepID=A0ABX2AEX4_9PROT|nr:MULTISPECIES: phosphatidylglycerophosphatase A [Komagataeibacter]MBV1830035.1 phosphatidylglycerophosphatase A [Komagataeibacter melomenusus]NPC66745.1 phosphatidylglycerophosphatase A [Komagataeibacter melomenusus]
MAFSPARFIASFCGTGFAPRAPGTVGSLAALIVGVPLLGQWLWMALAVLVVTFVGYRATQLASGGEDHGWIVIDEVAGMWIAMFPLAPLPLDGLRWADGLWLALAFALFRLFDITKPGPVGWFDRRHDALGIMGDDVVAGLMAAAILAGIRCLA